MQLNENAAKNYQKLNPQGNSDKAYKMVEDDINSPKRPILGRLKDFIAEKIEERREEREEWERNSGPFA